MSDSQQTRRAPSVSVFVGVAFLLAASVLGFAGCGGSDDEGGNGGDGEAGSGRRQFLSLGSAPPGGAFFVVGGAIAETLNAGKGDNNWKVTSKATKGSQENIRTLQSGELQLALSNSAITYFAVRGESSWDKKYNARAVVTLAPNIAMFIAKAESGITSIEGLKGKRVVIGPGGAGFEMFVEPLLKAHGVSMDDITPLNGTQTEAVDQLGDGTADAAFLGGAVPTASITQACSTYDIVFVPLDPETRTKLTRDYAFFAEKTIPADKYADLTEPFEGLDVGSMHLVTSADVDEDLIYQITKTIWENRKAIAEGHPAGRAINEKNAARYTGTDFHPGAIKFYKEIGIWPEDEKVADAAEDASVEDSSEESSTESQETPDNTDAADSPNSEASQSE